MVSGCSGTLHLVRRYVALDLETVPDEELVSAVDGEPSRPYADKLGRLLAARKAQSGGRSDFLPLPYHRPVVACAIEAVERDGALIVSDVSCWTDRRGPEESFLTRTFAGLHGRTLVTFHGRGFDLPVLELRSLKHGIPTPAWFAGARRAGSAGHLDLKDLLTASGAAPAAPLDLYAKLVGLPGKEDVAGADVQALYAAGRLDRIAAYCMTDVVQTWLLFLRYRLLEGSLTPDGYTESAEAARAALPRLFASRLGECERAILDGFVERCGPFFPPGLDRRRRAS